MPTLKYLSSILKTENEDYIKDLEVWMSFRDKMIETIKNMKYTSISCQEKQVENSCLITFFFGTIFKSYFIYKPYNPSLIKYSKKNKNSEWDDVDGNIEIDEGKFSVETKDGKLTVKFDSDLIAGEHMKILMQAIDMKTGM